MNHWGIPMINIEEIGTLDKRVTILKYEDVENEYNFTQKKLIPFLRIWARIEPLRGKDYYEQYKDKTEDFIKITVRYRESIDNSMLIKYKNKLYEINTIIDPYEAHVKLELMCSTKKVGSDDE